MFGRQTLFRQTLFRQTLFRQSAVRTTQYIFSTLRICRNSRNWEEIGMGRGVGRIESTTLIEALRWLRGAEPMGRVQAIPSGSGPCGVPSCGKSYNVLPTQLYLPLIFGIWFGVFPIGTARPIQLQSATRRPDCAWTVGIASVGTESVGIVWCTPSCSLISSLAALSILIKANAATRELITRNRPIGHCSVLVR